MIRILSICLFAIVFLSACVQPSITQTNETTHVKFATFNVSFAHDGDPSEHFEQWVMFMNIPYVEQEKVIQKWKNKQVNAQEKKLAERIIQIRNVAAIIQRVRPDILLLNEFNNDGNGEDYRALHGFQKHYLDIGQHINSIDGGEKLAPIHYPYKQSYATNTGLPSGLDLANNGYDPTDPNDAFGFGFYHGHYAFALLSKHQINTEKTRTFQIFKRKDLPNAMMPIINVCSNEKPLPKGLACGDHWFSLHEWENIRLSSKNHVDAPITIATNAGEKTIHLLLSHPTPPAFDSVSDNNKYRNSEENDFWRYYISNDGNLYDDNGIYGGLNSANFVIMGDLNADTTWGTTTDKRFNGIQRLMNHPLVNQALVKPEGKFVPTSEGGAQEPNRRNHPYPAIRTATFGTRADYAVSSATLSVVDSGVYWQAAGQDGRRLFNDERIGKRGADKEVSSDHRLVWVTIEL